MKKALLVFGSKSDEKVYDKIVKSLKEDNFEIEMRICSAHRTPRLLDNILEKSEFDLIIAGAGLAAHLPGVIASKIIKPVIGIPISNNYEGMDSMLSIMQMPPGIPVISTGVNGSYLTNNVKLLGTEYCKVNIIGDFEKKPVINCIEMLNRFKIKYKRSKTPDEDALNIYFFELGFFNKFDEPAFYINVPMKDDSSINDSAKVMELSDIGFWVGLNRGENAALAAIQIINQAGKYDDEFNDFRKEMQDKIKEQDKELNV